MGKKKQPPPAPPPGTMQVQIPPFCHPYTTVQLESPAGSIRVQVPRGATSDKSYNDTFDVRRPDQPTPPPGTILVTVPQGTPPGATLQVTAPGGQPLMAQVPPGLGPGSQFALNVPGLQKNYQDYTVIPHAERQASAGEITEHPAMVTRIKSHFLGCGDSDQYEAAEKPAKDCCGIPCFCFKTNRQRADLILKKFSPTPVDRATPGGVVKVNGRVVATDGHLRAPCSGRSCVYYEVRVEQYVTTYDDFGFAHSAWMPLVRVVKGIDFALEAGGVTCHVDQVRAGLRAASGFDYFVGGPVTADGQGLKGVSGHVPPELYDQIQEWLRAAGCVMNACRGAANAWQGGLRVSEKAFVVGEPLACCGRLVRQGGKLVLAAATRDAVPKEERSRWTSDERNAWHEILEPANACGPKDFCIPLWIGCIPYGVILTCCDCHRLPCRKGKRGPAVLASSDPADLEGGGADPYFEGGGSAPGPAAMAERETEVMAEGVVVGV